MTDKKEPNPKGKPSHIALVVRDYETADGEMAGSWSEIGAAWINKDGKGLSVQLHALPVDGRFVLRINDKKKAKKDAE